MTLSPQQYPTSMAKEDPKRQKYYVSRKEKVDIKCRSCGRTETFPVAELKAKKYSMPENNPMQIKCVCSQTFEVDFEFRQDYRQKANIAGSLRTMTTPRIRARQCRVVDYSAGGLLLAINDALPIKKDDRLIVSYRPNADSSEIERVIMVRHCQSGSLVGCAFIDNGAGLPASATLQ